MEIGETYSSIADTRDIGFLPRLKCWVLNDLTVLRFGSKKVRPDKTEERVLRHAKYSKGIVVKPWGYEYLWFEGATLQDGFSG